MDDSSSLKLTAPVGLRVILNGKMGSSSFPSWSYLKNQNWLWMNEKFGYRNILFFVNQGWHIKC